MDHSPVAHQKAFGWWQPPSRTALPSPQLQRLRLFLRDSREVLDPFPSPQWTDKRRVRCLQQGWCISAIWQEIFWPNILFVCPLPMDPRECHQWSQIWHQVVPANAPTTTTNGRSRQLLSTTQREKMWKLWVRWWDDVKRMKIEF